MLPGFKNYVVLPYNMLLDLKYAARLYIICCPALKRCCVALKLRYYDLYYLACHLRNFYIHLFRLAELRATAPFQTSSGCQFRPRNYNAIPALCDCTEPLAIWRNPLSPLGYKQRFFQPLQDPLGAQRPSLSSPLRHKGVFLGRAIVSRS